MGDIDNTLIGFLFFLKIQQILSFPTTICEKNYCTFLEEKKCGPKRKKCGLIRS